MGYEIHITRADHWAANEGHEITREEWLALVSSDPELTFDPVNGDDYALWSGRCRYSEPWFGWSRGRISTTHPDKPMIAKMIQIAAKLGGRVQGDEGEFYDASYLAEKREEIKGAGCASSGQRMTADRQGIKAALESLLRREGQAFVIFQEPISGKFIQFAGSSQEPLLLDLPSTMLSVDEMARATTFFAELGVSPAPFFDDHVTFQLNLGQDIDRATDLTLSILRDVYLFPPDLKLDVVEN